MTDFVSDKRIVLDNPGQKQSDLYYSTLNSTVEEVECHYSFGRYKQSLNTATFGGQSQFTIPVGSFLGEVVLHIRLPTTVANQTLCRGWGYGLIGSVNFNWGSSNISNVNLTGQSILQTLMSQCETAEKRNELFRLGGEEILTDNINPEANIIIPLPWSTMCALSRKKLFDTNVLNSPITVSIGFNPAADIYGGEGAKPTSFLEATALVRQGDLANKANSLRMLLQEQPDLMMAYPFIHHQNYQQRFTVGNPAITQSVTLQSFINADLTAITIGVVRDARKNPVPDESKSPFAYDDLRNVVLKYNGQVVFEAPGSMMKLASMLGSPGAAYWHNSVIQVGTTGPFNSDPVDTYLLCIDFSRIKSTCFEGEYQNTWRIGNQVMTLDFEVEAADTYTLYATYHYNALCEVQKGQTMIYFS